MSLKKALEKTSNKEKVCQGLIFESALFILANILDTTLFQKSDNLVQDKSELNLSRAFEYIPLLLCEVHNIAMYFTRVP